MFLKNLEKFYSYNLLSILGWIFFIIDFCFYMAVYFGPWLLKGNPYIDGESFLLSIFIVFCRSVLFVLGFLFILLIEIIFSIRKKKISDNIKLSILKFIGVLFVLLPIIIIGGIILCADISSSYEVFIKELILYFTLIFLPISILSYFSYRRRKHK